MSEAEPASHYPGSELELFAEANRWKRYIASEIRPFLGERVLEVGAGRGGTTRTIAEGRQTAWLCLEPDPALADALRASIARGEIPSCCRVESGTIASLAEGELFDSILYIDVLEHILDDAGEMREAARHLARGGSLVVLGPAHPWLYSPFDETIGHHRRYTRQSLRAVAPHELELVRLCYLDSLGLLASAANRFARKKALPTRREIAIWDRFLVGTSTWLDPILGHRIGKSVLGVWRRPA